MNETNKTPVPHPPVHQFFGSWRFLSNFWLAEFEWEGMVWPSTECAYQAAKTLDVEARQAFLTMTPGQAKRAGKSVVLREDWDEIKVDIMYEIVKAKFEQNEHLKEKLLATGDAHLEEGNTWGDRIWGVSPPGSGQGKNHLGKILMRIRLELSLFEE